MKTMLATINGEGFTSDIILEDNNGVEYVYFVGDLDIDADGANAQSGEDAAYVAGNMGSEDLANGGMKMQGGRVVFSQPWGKDIVFTEDDGQPRVLANGVIPSRTAYVRPALHLGEELWRRQMDSETIRYIVVPPVIISRTRGIVRGCRARLTYQGKSIEAIVGDVGPRNRVGEASIAAARALGIPSNPRTGGLDGPHVKYEVWPGQTGVGLFAGFALQRADGSYLGPLG